MSAAPRIVEIDAGRVVSLLPHPAADSNKYSRGVLVAIGGSSDYPGAICLATAAAYCMGAGYVEAFCSPEALPLLRSHNLEVVARAWDDWDPETSRIAHAREGHPCACLVGSGMASDDSFAMELVLDALQHAMHPVVVDGGGISSLATEDGLALAVLRARRRASTIVTPHFGEATRLARAAGIDVPDVRECDEGDMVGFAQRLANGCHAIVVLKGQDTFIAAPTSPRSSASPAVFAMRFGTAALAKAGTGDVLAGTIASLAAQGLPSIDAACLGASVHGLAGRVAEAALTDICVCASDVVAALPDVVKGDSLRSV